MKLIRGSAGGTTLTGTVYEPDERPPGFRGSPDVDAPFVWVCDECYQVPRGGLEQRIGDRTIQVAFESPLPRGFRTLEDAVEAGKEHVRTQFVRLGVDRDEVEVAVREADAGEIR